MTPKEMKTTCQSGDPATDGIADCGLSIAEGGTLGISKLTG
jgi:hypothetical protein